MNRPRPQQKHSPPPKHPPVKTATTVSGFPLVEFKDYYDIPCSIQASSLAIYQQPGTSAIWLGVDDAQPKILASKAVELGIETTETTGWIPFPIPSDVSLSTRMHLDRKQVKVLIGLLQTWLNSDNGQFV